MGRYVAVGFGLVTLVIAVDTASGRWFGCPRTQPNVCYTCPIPNFSGGNACLPSSDAPIASAACDVPCATPAAAPATVAAPDPQPTTAAETPIPTGTANETPRPMLDAPANPPTEAAQLPADPVADAPLEETPIADFATPEYAAPEVATPEAATASSADASEASEASVDQLSSADEGPEPTDAGDRYTERPQSVPPATRPLFREPSTGPPAEELLPIPAELPRTIESTTPTPLGEGDAADELDDIVPSIRAEEAATDDRYVVPEPTNPAVDIGELFQRPSDDRLNRPTELPDSSAEEPASVQDGWVTPSESMPAEGPSAEPEAPQQQTTEEAESPAGEATPGSDEPMPEELPGELTDEDFFGAEQVRPRPPVGQSPVSRPSNSRLVDAPLRQWSDDTGLYQCDARLVGVASAGVTLERADGQQRTIAWSRLSTGDLQYLKGRLDREQWERSGAGQVAAAAVSQD